ncbi:uncharacterized protein M6B38_258000 [Iris pallida]|uniref:Uncharacterized protein n=1 Tax=Iris pallida TaxID=29817 RepID=A0AAX6IGI5_IRIPA|nr:uncharacterized protein M6B38_258000 [Iris pallida]
MLCPYFRHFVEFFYRSGHFLPFFVDPLIFLVAPFIFFVDPLIFVVYPFIFHHFLAYTYAGNMSHACACIDLLGTCHIAYEYLLGTDFS